MSAQPFVNSTRPTEYGPILRVGPNDIDIADGAAISVAYSNKIEFSKSECYPKLAVDGHETIFSTLDSTYRAIRIKVVLPLFSLTSIRQYSSIIDSCATNFVGRLKKDSVSGKPVDVMNLARSFTCDVTTAYLFCEEYGALEETSSQLSASQFVDSFLDVSRFFHLLTVLFNVLRLLAGIISSDDRLNNSVATIDTYIKRMVEGSKANAESYSSRLLDQGISAGETTKHPHMEEINTEEKFTSRLLTMGRYETLRMEVMDLRNLQVDPQALPYFSGVDKDGLRLAMVSPTRLPRKVPASGMNVQGYYFPRSTNVGHGSF
ncbi:benzoate 4-monooxygenase cytochrome protein [Pochonia chlamydosporia 170]|uniref:Benzoate 4-monooxygenase cytochrome protein n=1 Tax=Pochonia chlamydosporia 170 TaxID=1380566 RepID=A0A179FPV0_METCM|nr:benzoate 4-monooxygenase cytochrome protein [Pochonia chlamydosporia 170]OAQ67614.2 benzoate 4-monooxygenase cytochrome protein [Pochonia chlamydosporia 170]